MHMPHSPDSTLARQEPDSLLRLLASRREGLRDSEVQCRLRAWGGNRVEAVGKRRLWLALAKEFSHFFAIVLWFAAILALVAEHLEPGQGMAELGAAIIGVIVINGCFSFWQARRAAVALDTLSQLLPQQVAVRRNGGVETVDAEQLVPGDIVLLAEGDKVPADCRILESTGLRVNMATLTGESLPRLRSAEDGGEPGAPLESRCLLLAGTLIVAGACSAVVFATGMRTEFGRIAHLAQTAGEVESPLQREIRHLSRWIALLAMLLGMVFFAIGQLVGLGFWASFLFAIGIIVANVPEGLLPTVTLSLALATQRMARRNALVRHLTAVETLGSATVILTDKTGTLTQNVMTVRESFVSGRHRLASQSWPSLQDFHLRAVARFCHSLKFRNGEPIGDPMEKALWQFAGDLPEFGRRAAEIPFDAERRRMSVLTEDQDGRSFLWCKGAPEVVMPLCTHWHRGETELPLDDEARSLFQRAHEDMACRGMRVLALAWKSVPAGSAGTEAQLENGLCLCGLVGLDDPPRPDVHEAVARCHAAGLRVIVVTGDHPDTAVALARQVDIVRCPSPTVLTGEALRAMSAGALQRALDAEEILFARVTAEQKMRIVQALQRKGEIVAVTGDGVNDAPALKTADIGIAMGLSGTDVARESADIVLLDDHFASIVNAVEEGRAVYENIRKFLTYILTSNVPEIVPYLAFVLFRIPLPLTVIQILAVDLGTDMLPALALGGEKPDPGVMERPPRPRQDRLLSRAILARAYLFLGPLEALGAMTVFFFILARGGWVYGDLLPAHDPLYLQATTGCLASIVLAQMVNVLLCRHHELPAWRFSLRGNPLLLAGLLMEAVLLLALVYHPWGNRLFGTEPLAPEVWLCAMPLALLLGLLEEARKWRLRAQRGKA